MQIDAMRRQTENEGKLGQAFQSAFGPNPNLVQNDDEGNPMPQVPGGGGMPELIRTVGAFDPRTALSMMPKPKEPSVHTRKQDEDVVDSTGRVLVKGTPKPEGPQKGAIREVKSGGKIITYEHDGSGWVKIADAPQFKPEGPEKPARPQLFDGPNGPVWITPPGSGGGAVPVVGPDGKPLQSKQSAKEADDAEKAARRKQGAIESANFVLGQVKSAIEKVGMTTAGPVGAVMRNVPGSKAFDLNKTVDSIKANIGFDTLQAMRDASPTGGALGQVAVQELTMLQAARGSLDTAQSPDQVMKALYGIEKHYTNWLQAVKQSQQSQNGGVRRYNPETGKIE